MSESETHRAERPAYENLPHRPVIEQLAGAAGLSPAEMREQLDNRLREAMSIPSDECLTPDDIVEYQTHGLLPDEFDQHRRSCASCAAIFQAVDPGPLPAPIREAAELAARSWQARPVPVHSGWNWRLPAMGIAACTALVISVPGVWDPSRYGRPEQPATVANASSAVPSQPASAVPVQVEIKSNPAGSAAGDSVLLRYIAQEPTKITVRDFVPEVAAALAVAKSPPSLNLPPTANDELRQRLTNFTANYVAGTLRQAQNSLGSHYLVFSGNEENSPTIAATKNGPADTITLQFTLHDQVFSQQLNLAQVLGSARQLQPAIKNQLAEFPAGQSDFSFTKAENKVSLKLVKSMTESSKSP